MNANTHECDHERIEAFLDSDRFGLEDNELTEHLCSCAHCRSYLESRAADTGTWTNAANMLRTTEFDNATTVEFSAAFPGPPKVEQTTLIRQVLKTLAPTDDPHRLGRIGEYEVTGVVGAGGMGVVLKAVDPSLDRVVAIKVMSPYLAHQGNARKRFEREAKAAAAVLHPNVIPIHSVYGGDPVPYLVMAYIRGGSLQKRLDHEGSLQTLDILRIGSQVAAGLAAAHEQGLIHRDIKPENILLEEGVERVTITDFGLARTVDDSSVTQAGVISGTPRYMSPEQARGDSLDQQSDLFSLGSVLYTLCTGRPPFRADTSIGVMRRITDETPTPIREINPDIPYWLEHIVNKLMAKDKADRFASANEVHKLLEACLNHVQQPTQTDLPASLRERQGPTKPRRGILPFLTSTHGVLTMIGLLTAGILTFTASILIGPANNTNTDPPDTKVVEKDISVALDPLQGDWKTFIVVEDGEFQRSGGTIRIHGNTLGSLDENGNLGESLPFEIDNSTDPKQIDLIEYKQDGSEERSLGIYQIKGDTLQFCFIEQVGANADEKNAVKRPTSFESPKGSKITLMELRKEPAKTAVEQIQGNWDTVAVTLNGQPQPAEKIASIGKQVHFKGNAVFFIDEKGDVIDGFSCEIDSTTDPKQIDLVDDKQNSAHTFLGIYEIKEDTLKLCFVEQIGAKAFEQEPVQRPTTFEAPRGSNFILLELRRQPAGEVATPDELKPVQGMWRVTRSVKNDRAIAGNDKAFLSITGNEFTFIELEDGVTVEKPIRLMAKIDSKQSPTAIDLYDPDGTLRMIGIFEAQDNNMKLCFVQNDGEYTRPAGFVPPVGQGARLIELKREGDVKHLVEDDPFEEPER
jgi:uncharacterized protein (TIGR03067 family)